MAALSSDGANGSLSQKLNKMIAGGSVDYNSWRSLILEIETATPEDINTISLAYESFLSIFPLCHWHREKYAYHKAELCSPEEALNIYEKGAGTAMFSVGFWVDYFTFGTACLGPEDVRRLFRRAVSFIGKDYVCHVLWDKYMKYEFNQEGWSFLAQSYIEALRFPTKKLHFYYDNFKQFVANLEDEIEYEKSNSMVEQVFVPCAETEISTNEISLVIKDLLGSSDISLKSKALDKYRSIGEKFYEEAHLVDEKIKCFETKIGRRYFHVTPLDDDQLNNWHLYLDFIEKQDNVDTAIKLYEKCLIPCANYPEFWMRYVDFLEAKGGRELAISALDRATQIYLKNVVEIHLFNSRFKEHIGDANGARAALVQCATKSNSGFIENVVALANLERRLGDSEAASATYEKALKKETQKPHVLSSLYSQFARLTFLITGSAAAARDVLIEGVQHVPNCRFLLEELIKFVMTHDGARHVNIIDSVVADSISHGLDEYQGLNANDRETISCLFLEFVNLCGTIHDIRKAWNRHIKLFPQFLRKHSSSGNYSLDLVREQKRKYDPPVHNQPSKKPSPGHCSLLQGQEEVLQPMVDSAELADQTKEDVDLSNQSGGEKPGQMDVSEESAKRSKVDALSPHDSAYEVGKSKEASDSVEATRSSLIYDQPELDREFKQQRHPVSLDNISLNSREKESQDQLIPVSCDEYETGRGVAASSQSTPLGIDRPNEPERDGSVRHQQNEPSGVGEDPTKIDRMVSAPIQKNTPSEVEALQEDKAIDQNQYTSMMTASGGLPPPVSSQPVSYPQQEKNQMNSQSSSEHPWEAQQSMAMSQMLQYYYHQQQLWQQQYQQQYMQHPYYQVQAHYMNQQPNQLQPHQHNQLQLVHQQQYIQQQQHQSLPYQLQQGQQIAGHVQVQQGQEPHPDFQQGHEKQQTQDLSHQVHQLGYQEYGTQGQHLLLQQYQQYQGYQHQQEAPNAQDDLVQQHHQKVISKENPTESMSQNQQGSRTSPPDYDRASRPSKSPHRRVRSPR